MKNLKAQVLGCVTVAALLISPAAWGQDCPADILQTLDRSLAAFEEAPAERRIETVAAASVARNTCQDNADALGTAVIVYNRAASAFTSGPNMLSVYSAAFDTALLSERAFDALQGDNQGIYTQANGALQNVVRYLLFLADAGDIHPIFQTLSLEACPYTVNEQRRVREEAVGYLETVAQFAISDQAVGYAESRLEMLQTVCSAQERWLLEARAELHLNRANTLRELNELEGVRSELLTAQALLEASYELTGTGRPYRTIERLSAQISAGLAETTPE